MSFQFFIIDTIPTHNMTEYIYLFHTKEFVNSRQPIYKFGKTTKLNHGALEEHPVGTRVIFQISCDDCHVLERKINSFFTVNYEPKKQNERGYFKGSERSMLKDIFMFYGNYKETSLLNAQIREYQRNVVIEEDVKVEEVKIDEDVKIEEVKIEEVKDNEVKDNEVKIDDEEIIEEIDVHTCCCSTKCFKGFTIYGCLMCSFSTTELLKMNQHLASEKNLFDSIPRKIDKTDLFECGYCDKRFKTPSGKWKHSKNAHNY